jgi:thioredoxin-like negative regulator of GroEL
VTERLLIAGALILAIVLLGLLIRAWDRRRCAQIAESRAFSPAVDNLPQIVTFYGMNCDACEHQKRIIQDLVHSRPGVVTVNYIDAASEASLALSYGVIVVPTTLVISSSGRIVSMTSGVLSRERLTNSLASAI